MSCERASVRVGDCGGHACRVVVGRRVGDSVGRSVGGRVEQGGVGVGVNTGSDVGSESIRCLARGLRERLVVRHGHLWTVLGHEDILDEPEFVAGALEQLREVQLLLVDLQFETVHALGDLVQALAQRALRAA